MNWEEIRKRFLRELAAAEKELARDLSDFLRRFLEKLAAEGFTLTPELEEELRSYTQKHEAFLRRLIETSAAQVAVGLRMEGGMRDEFVAETAEEIFRRRFADGRNLSERIWWITDEIRRGMQETLAEGIRMDRAVDRIVYEMQYMIEREMGASFVQVTTDQLPRWVEALWETSRALIRDPEARAAWEKTLEQVERHVERLSREGTYHASKRLLYEVKRAVEAGREDLLLRALNWWLYHRQLYYLKRVARTEAANAFHLAQIKATEDDPDVIGYQWRLSRSHPRADICDWYASVDFGLGKGVWPKDRVPRSKAHPHCLCYLLPRVTPERRRGARNFGELWERLDPARKQEILPKWARNLAQAGVSPDEFLGPDRLSFLSRKDFIARLGKERFEALSAIGGALSEVRWPEIRIRPSGRMTKRTLEALEKHRHAPEVRRVLSRIEAGEKIHSRDWHYLKRKYVDNASLGSPLDLDRMIDRVLRDKEARIFRPGERIIVFSEKTGWYAIIEKSGRRITAYPARDDKWPENFLGRTQDLLKNATEAAS